MLTCESLLTWSMVCHSFDVICIPSKIFAWNLHMVDGVQQHFFLELAHMVDATQKHLLCSDLSMWSTGL